ncbi:GapR family DNA-binding domain-containing protein [Bradyrhizobium sp. HKCCYLRH3099]|uniref:GapR family DNA-binding domain-containing protein n=1 Tax=unclassified Bradyrhizobium TaxID=2631580 RepID=UPI003EBAA511
MASNTGIDGETDAPSTRFAVDQLKSIIERIERLEEEKKEKADDIKDVYAEAKSNGLETKALRRIVRLRRLDGPQKAAHEEVESILETYMQALGML